jgi:glycosyltransferase involved in cell wall biosynthesis
LLIEGFGGIMNKFPLISIVIPVYNGSNYLAEAIDSALTQTYPNIEVIVINDGSNDNGATRSVALSYNNKIKYYEKNNGGVASALNYGIGKMQGDYFSWLSHDDKYYPTKIEEQIKFVSEGGEDIIIYSDFDSIDETGILMSTHNLPSIYAEHFRFWLTYTSWLNGCTLLIPLKAFKDVGIFDENLLTTQDYDLWFRFAEHFRFIHLPKVLVSSRQHSKQATKRMPDIVMKECNNLHFGFFSQLKASELPGPEVKSYLKLAKSFFKRHFYEASFLSFGRILQLKLKIRFSIYASFYKYLSALLLNADK